jgi:riboflavin kinase/FMN adenylyltransferase
MIITGRVIRGDKRGAKQGFPTANLNRKLAAGKITKGVYACLVEIKNKKLKGILIYGAPDNENKPKLEVFFLNFRQNIYHRVITVKIIGKIRPL